MAVLEGFVLAGQSCCIQLKTLLEHAVNNDNVYRKFAMCWILHLALEVHLLIYTLTQ